MKKTGIRKLREGCFEATVCLSGSRNKKRRRFALEIYAVNWRIKTLAELRRGKQPSASRIPMMAEALKDYRDWARGRRPATEKFTASACNRLAKVEYFQKRIDLVTGQDIERWRRELASEGLSSRTVDHYTERLHRMFSLFKEWKVLEEIPPMRLTKENEERVRYLSDDEEAALLAACSPKLSALVRFALATGARKGELRNLTWSQVDKRARIATVPAPRSKGKRDRRIRLNETALAVLDGLPKPIRDDLRVFPSEGGKMPPRKGDRGGESQENGPRVWWRLDHAFRAARRRAVKGDKKRGQPPCPSLADFHFHDLRHTFASRLAMAGVDLWTVAQLLGHTDVKQTQRYAHLSPGHLEEAVAVLDRKGSAVNIAVNDSTEGS